MIILCFVCPVPKACTNLSFVRMDHLLQYTPNTSLTCIKQVRITDSSQFSEIESLYRIILGLTINHLFKMGQKSPLI